MTKKERQKMQREKREQFFKEYADDLIKCYDGILYPSFIKLKVRDKVYDYYPGAERISTFKDGQYVWFDCSHDELLNLLQ